MTRFRPRLSALLAALGTVLLVSLPAGAATRVMILPFDAPEGNSELQSLGPGTMDSLIVALKRLPDFIVVDRATLQQAIKEQAFQQSGLVEGKTAIRLGKLLGAQVMVSGRVQVVSDRVRLSATYVDVETGVVKQAETVPGQLKDVFDLQDQLARQFVANQGVQVTPTQAETITRTIQSTSNLTAYDAYQRGRTAYLRFNPDGYREAVDWYRKALAGDSGYALAYAGLSEAMTLWAHYQQQSGKPYQALLEEAHEAARKALALKEDLPEANRAMAIILQRQGLAGAKEYAARAAVLAPNEAESWWALWLTGDRDPGSSELKQCMDLNPRLLTAIVDRGVVYASLGRYDDAIYEFRTAARLQPDDPMVHNELGIALKSKNRLDEAIESYRTAIRLNPDFAQAHFNLGLALKSAGRPDEAMAAYQAAIQANPAFALAYTNLGNALRERGQTAEAITAYGKAIALMPNEPSAHFNLGVTLKAAGRSDEAVRALNRFIELAPSSPAVSEARRLVAELSGPPAVQR